MVFRIDTTCPRCGKEDSVFGRSNFCDDCALEGFFKSQIKQNRRAKKLQADLRELKPDIRKELHEKLLKEILAEKAL